jgi:hypothetical protein
MRRHASAAETNVCSVSPQLTQWWTAALRNTSPAPDAVLNTLRYLFFHARCGVLVALRGGRVALVAPFANAAYTNTWAHRVVTDIDTYARQKAYASAKPVETLLPPSAWWLNGGVVCNVMPEGVWGSAHLPELLQQLRATEVAFGDLPDCTFFFNKRDFPQLTLDGSDAVARFTGESRLAREAYTHHAPIVSFYGGGVFADCVAPLSEDWRLACDKELVATSTFAACDVTDGWESTAPVAVWRGAPTGYDLTPARNQRIALVHRFTRTHAAATFVDALFVCSGPGGRDRLVPVPAPVPASTHADAGVQHVTTAALPALRLTYFDPACVEPALPVSAVPLPLAAQRAAYRYIIYVDGHCAANRYGALMHSGRVILKVMSMHDDDGGGRQWLFPSLVGLHVSQDGSCKSILPLGSVRSPDHCIIDADLANIEATIQYLREHDAEARAIAAAAAAAAPTRQMITATWLALLQQLNDTCCPPSPPSGHDVWFSPYDTEYARCGKPQSSSLYSTYINKY